MTHKIRGPFKLGEIYTNSELAAVHSEDTAEHIGKHIAIDASNHGAIATVVWKMRDDDRSSECEAFAKRIVASLNFCNEMTDSELGVDE